MNHKNKAMGLLAQVAKGLLAHGANETAVQLGDRSAYVGMSDIGKGMECMRAAVAAKAHGNRKDSMEDIALQYQTGGHDRIRRTLQKQLILQRGHWLEAGIGQALAANGANLIPQLEIAWNDSSVPIRAHLDFTMVWGDERPAVRVLELKSTERIPKTLYPSYETQLYGQLGLLAKCWNHPCFSMRDAAGVVLFSGVTFPELARRMFGVSLPEAPDSVDIEGWVLCISMSDARAFGPYVPDATMLNVCRRVAKGIWTASRAVRDGSQSLNDIDHCRGFHPLCDWCEFAADCPKFTTRHLDDAEYDRELSQLADLKSRRTDLEDEIVAREQRIHTLCRLMSGNGDWLATSGYRFKSQHIKGRSTLDRNKLIVELTRALGEDAASSLLDRVTRTGAGHERLYVSRMNNDAITKGAHHAACGA